MDNTDPNRVYRLTRDNVLELDAKARGSQGKGDGLGINLAHSKKFNEFHEKMEAEFRASGETSRVVDFSGNSQEHANALGSFAATWEGKVTFTAQVDEDGRRVVASRFEGTVQVWDEWDFDLKPFGASTRTWSAEVQTRAGALAPGTRMRVGSAKINVVQEGAAGRVTFGDEVTSSDAGGK